MQCPHCKKTIFTICIDVKDCKSKEDIANKIKYNQAPLRCNHCNYTFYAGGLIQDQNNDPSSLPPDTEYFRKA